MADFLDVQTAYFRKGREAALEAIKKHAADETDRMGSTLLHEAARQGDVAAVRYLIDNGARAGKTDGYGCTPLFALTQSREWEKYPDDIYACAKTLLAAKCPVSRRDEYGWCCYHRAAEHGVYPLLTALAETGARCDALIESSCDSALHIACASMEKYSHLIGKPDFNRYESNYLKTAQTLLKMGLDAFEENTAHKTPFDYAVDCKALRIAAALRGEQESDTLLRETGGLTLFQAADRGDIEALAALIRHGNDVNQTADDGIFGGLTPLMAACRAINPDAVRLLTEAGASVSYKNADQHPALYYLCGATEYQKFASKQNTRENYAASFDALFKGGLNVDDTVDGTHTALGYLCANANRAWDTDDGTVQEILAEKLLRAGADCDVADAEGTTPLTAVCTAGGKRAETLAYLLLEQGANVFSKNRYGDNAAICAARLSDSAVALSLLRALDEFGFSAYETVNNAGKSALDYAAELSNDAVVKFILSNM